MSPSLHTCGNPRRALPHLLPLSQVLVWRFPLVPAPDTGFQLRLLLPAHHQHVVSRVINLHCDETQPDVRLRETTGEAAGLAQPLLRSQQPANEKQDSGLQLGQDRRRAAPGATPELPPRPPSCSRCPGSISRAGSRRSGGCWLLATIWKEALGRCRGGMHKAGVLLASKEAAFDAVGCFVV